MADIEKDVLHIKRALDAQGKILSRLSNAITGDEEFGTTGIANQCKKNSEYIQNDKLFKAKVTGIASGISAFFAVVTSVIMKMIFKD
tara:strand:+ start:1589 stop:1849 length:261 start_codon:yes stop_codon:yes gene_type:complete